MRVPGNMFASLTPRVLLVALVSENSGSVQILLYGTQMNRMRPVRAKVAPLMNFVCLMN
jgi:hypothetical protein